MSISRIIHCAEAILWTCDIPLMMHVLSTQLDSTSKPECRQRDNQPPCTVPCYFPFPPTPFLFSFFQALEKLSSYTYCQLQTAGCVLALERVIHFKTRLNLIKAIHFSYFQCLSNATAHHSILEFHESYTNQFYWLIFFHFSYRYFLPSTSKERKIICSCLPSSEDVSDH